MSAHDETLTPATLAGLGAASPAAAPTQRARFEADDVAAERHRSRERRRRLLRMARRGLLGFALVLAGVGVVWALRPKPVPVDATLAVRGQLVVAIEESGQTRVKDRYVVSAPVTGSLGRVRLEAGDEVRAGEPLAEIAPTVSPLLDERTRAESEARLGAALSALGQARTQTARAAAAKELAERDLQRARGLGQSGSITRQAVDQAEFEARVRTEDLASAEFAVKVAAEQVRVARMTLSRDGATGRGRHVDVLAPVTGRVLRVQQESAGVVAAGSPLVEIGDPRNLEVIVDLLTSDAVQVKPGTAVEIKGWGGA
ncbi:MAG TPA: HlyD family efflux transporter periplasmic adaptor subunit, partial [Polyangia bacterium]